MLDASNSIKKKNSFGQSLDVSGMWMVHKVIYWYACSLRNMCPKNDITEAKLRKVFKNLNLSILFTTKNTETST